MIRKVTKASTVTPKSTMTKSQSVGQGVKNMGKAKKYGPVTMAMGKKAASEGAMEMAPQGGFFKKSYKDVASSVAAGALGSTIMPKPKKERMATNKTTTKPKAKAKMLPEVKVTAPGKLKRFVSKITSKRK